MVTAPGSVFETDRQVVDPTNQVVTAVPSSGWFTFPFVSFRPAARKVTGTASHIFPSSGTVDATWLVLTASTASPGKIGKDVGT